MTRYKDFVGVSELATTPNTFVVKSDLPAKTMKEFVALARANPDKFNVATPPIGTTPQIQADALKIREKLPKLAGVVFKGGGDALQALLSGTVQLSSGALPPALQHIKAGTLRCLAICGESRWPDLPDVPTMQEAGYKDFVFAVDCVLLAPAKTPPEAVKWLETETLKVLGTPDMKEKLYKTGFQVRPKGAEGCLGARHQGDRPVQGHHRAGRHPETVAVTPSRPPSSIMTAGAFAEIPEAIGRANQVHRADRGQPADAQARHHGRRDVSRADNVLVRIETDTGLVGWGEAASAPVMTGETLESIVSAVHYLEPALRGREPADIAGALAAMDDRMYGNHGAKAAIEIALHDLAGRAATKPVHALLGDKQRSRMALLGRDRRRRFRRRSARCRKEEGRRLSPPTRSRSASIRRQRMPSAPAPSAKCSAAVC